MYGNGWPGSTASGVSTGKMRSSNTSTRCSRSSSSSSSQSEKHDAGLGQRRARRSSRKTRSCAVDELARPGRGSSRSCSAGRAAVGRGGAEPGGHLVLQAGHPDLEELVEVLAEDGQELGPLEQRHRRVLGQGQDPGVEVEPRQLAVEEPLRRLGRRARSRSAVTSSAVHGRIVPIVPGTSAGRRAWTLSVDGAGGGGRSSSGRPRSQSRMRFSRSASRTTRSRLRRNCGSWGGSSTGGPAPGPGTRRSPARSPKSDCDLPVRGDRAEVDHADVALGVGPGSATRSSVIAIGRASLPGAERFPQRQREPSGARPSRARRRHRGCDPNWPDVLISIFRPRRVRRSRAWMTDERRGWHTGNCARANPRAFLPQRRCRRRDRPADLRRRARSESPASSTPSEPHRPRRVGRQLGA